NLLGGFGNDTLTGGADNDVFRGEGDNDTLRGNAGADTLIGDNGDNNAGVLGKDTLYGGAGNDILKGDAGDDKLFGGAGNDQLTGGLNKDSFIFDTALNKSTNVDHILDFSHVDDTIQLENSIFKGITAANLHLTFYLGTKAHDADDRIIYDKASGALYYDSD